MQTQETVALELTHDEVEATLNALIGWDKHIQQLLGALPLGKQEREAVASVRSKLMVKRYGPEGPLKDKE